MIKNNREPSSFRDPSGFLFWRNGELYRQINQIYQDDYELAVKSGLYQQLVNEELLIPHEEAALEPHNPKTAFRVIKPQNLPFISYPYEWCFSQLRDAALTTLAIQKHALENGMSLKDASAYNIQFWRGKPVLIDTLSFEKYQAGKPWVAYRQFCQHFLAPLALMSFRDIRLSQFLRIYIDGIPLDLASKLLPFRTRFNFHLLTHIHFHAAAQNRYAGAEIDLASPQREVKKTGMLGILNSLEAAIYKLKWDPKITPWADYEQTHGYTQASHGHKKHLVSSYLDKVNPKSVWDLGANTGDFSRLASQRKIPTFAFDVDPGAVELNYRQCAAEDNSYLLPLLLDITNPSPDLGWFNRERQGLINRKSAEMIFALALIHHLAITNNLPLHEIAQFMAELSIWLVIEFVPKHDPQTQRLLASREDIFQDYTSEKFEDVFKAYYTIEDSSTINDSERTLYLMKRI